MRKILSMLLCLLLAASVAGAETVLNGAEDRGIVIEKPEDDHPWVEKGFSPTTGRVLSDVAKDAPTAGFAGVAITGRYMPMLVQIDNADGGIGYDEATHEVTGTRAPWGAQYADVIYETALYKAGDTRLSFLFSDLIPDSVGPLRSARLFHAQLREEWDCGFIYYGEQKYPITSVPEFFKLAGADKKAKGADGKGVGILFSGIVGGKKWKQYMGKYDLIQLQAPHDKNANVAAISSLIDPDFQAKDRGWLFTNVDPEWDDDGEDIYVNWGKQMYNSVVEWDDEAIDGTGVNEREGAYRRYMVDIDNAFGNEHEYKTLEVKDKLESDEILFQNVIVQFIDLDWPRTDAPRPLVNDDVQVTAKGYYQKGNADYFQRGKHMSGVWQRDSLTDRTVFYDEEGQELVMQRGKTLIIVVDYQTGNRVVSYE